jgi:hypothetical protein
MAKYVGTPRGGPPIRPISKADIIEAQKYTKSNAAAARYLGVTFTRYTKYAKIYNLYYSHYNKDGIGIAKGYAVRPSTVPLRDIFANKHPNYSLIRLKHRMIARGLLVDGCAMCGFNERRVTDGKTPTIITFKNGVRDYTQDNIELRCYNCLFLTTGAPTVAHKAYIEKSFTEPESIPANWQVDQREVDAIDVGEPDEPSATFDDIRTEVMHELHRT